MQLSVVTTTRIYMWEKETQVDRLGERNPLVLVMSLIKAAMTDPTKPRPRDWIGPVKQAGANGDFVTTPVSCGVKNESHMKLLYLNHIICVFTATC